MKKYTFNLNNNPSTFYAPNYKSTDYSKILDDLIAADIADKNPWLYSTTKKCTTTCPFADNCNKTIKIKINGAINDDLETAFIYGNKFTESDYNKAFNFLANLAYNCPFKKNTTYKLSNGDYIEITDDYIHINEKMYFFNLMDDNFFYNLSSKMKKTIATIYIDGLKITIKK
jgi:hypothetical protein